MINFLYVFLGGGIGALSRYGVGLLVATWGMRSWIGLTFVNVLGSALIFIWHKHYGTAFKSIDPLIKIGFLGGLTTFSSFSLELVELIKSGSYGEFAIVAISNVFAGIIIGLGILI